MVSHSFRHTIVLLTTVLLAGEHGTSQGNNQAHASKSINPHLSHVHPNIASRPFNPFSRARSLNPFSRSKPLQGSLSKAIPETSKTISSNAPRRFRNRNPSTNHSNSNPEESFSNYFLQAISSYPDVKIFLASAIPSPITRAYFFKIDSKFYRDCGYPRPVELANKIAEAVGEKDILKMAVYFHSVGNTFYEFGHSRGITTMPSFVRIYAKSLADGLDYVDSRNIEAVLKLLLDVFANAIYMLRIDVCDNVVALTKSFVKNIKHLNNVDKSNYTMHIYY